MHRLSWITERPVRTPTATTVTRRVSFESKPTTITSSSSSLTMNGLTPPPFDNDQEDDDRKPSAAAATVVTLDHKQSPYEHYANLPVNHLAVLKIKAWSPSTPSVTHLFTCTVNIAHDDGMLHSNKMKNRKDSLGFISEENEDDDDEEDDDDIGSDGIGRRDSLVHGPSFIQGRQNKDDDIYAGSLVGLHRPLFNQSSSSNKDENNNTSWNVDDTFHIRKVHFIPHTQIQSQLIHLLQQNDVRLQTLIMDGLPPSTFFHDTTSSSSDTTISELFTYALENNTSVRTLSLNYSHVNDELGNALANLLRNNTTLKHLSLVGNMLSSVTAKQFFNLIHNNNSGRRGSLRRNSIGSVHSGNDNNDNNNNNEISLQSLDLGENPDMDRDILEAVHQFMEQRELKRKLSNSLSIMSRDNDTNDDDAINYNHVTVVCHESILNGGNYDSQSVQLEEASIKSSNTNTLPEMETMPDLSPLPNESFMHYVNRVNPTTKKSAIKTVMAHQRLYAAVAQDGNTTNDDGNGILNKLDTSSSISSNPNHQRGNDNGPILTQEEKDARLKSDRKSIINNREDSQVGITHVNEVAPGRQSRSSRMRRTMTDSQRRLRLQSFTDVDDSARRMEDDNNNSSNRAFSRMKTQESDYYYDNESLEEGGNALKNVFGLDDPEVRIDFLMA
eukprot:scaffold14759_cov39-Cyclotella_meneghiniana.AAC.1